MSARGDWPESETRGGDAKFDLRSFAILIGVLIASALFIGLGAWLASGIEVKPEKYVYGVIDQETIDGAFCIDGDRVIEGSIIRKCTER